MSFDSFPSSFFFFPFFRLFFDQVKGLQNFTQVAKMQAVFSFELL